LNNLKLEQSTELSMAKIPLEGKRSLPGNKPRICVPILAKNTEEALKKIARANSLADILEFRLDVMHSFCLEKMLRVASRPVIVTYRSKKEGGEGTADYDTRTRYLLDAIEKGADLVDVEHSMPMEFKDRIFLNRGNSKIITSLHLMDGTPELEELKKIFIRLAGTGADIVKIITKAKVFEDNLHVLDLIPMSLKVGTPVIAFCMGQMGQVSRIFCCPLGGFLTFASLQEGQESADGQIPAVEMRKILEKFPV